MTSVRTNLTAASKILALGLLVSLAAAAFSAKWRLGLQQRLDLVVKEVTVSGRKETALEGIAEMLPIGTPLFALSPKRIKAKLEAMPWVRRAAVQRQLDGGVRIRLREKRPYALWQGSAKELVLIAEDGVIIGEKQAKSFPHLTVLRGEEALSHAPQFLKTLRERPIDGHGIKSLLLLGKNRWSVELANGITVFLPEEKPILAWEKLIEFNNGNRLLERNLKTVDMRTPGRLIVSVKSAADRSKNKPKGGLKGGSGGKFGSAAEKKGMAM